MRLDPALFALLSAIIVMTVFALWLAGGLL